MLLYDLIVLAGEKVPRDVNYHGAGVVRIGFGITKLDGAHIVAGEEP
jgi:hypothetical protein